MSAKGGGTSGGAENPAVFSEQEVAIQRQLSDRIQDEIDNQYQLLTSAPPQAYKIAETAEDKIQRKNSRREVHRGHLAS